VQVTQLNWRLSEGGGACLYALGVEDNGHPRGLSPPDLAASLEVLQAMAAEVGAEAEVLQVGPAEAGMGRWANPAAWLLQPRPVVKALRLHTPSRDPQ
jgi:GTPase